MNRTFARKWMQLSAIWIVVALVPVGRIYLFDPHLIQARFYIVILFLGLLLGPLLILWIGYLQRKKLGWILTVLIQIVFSVLFSLLFYYVKLLDVLPWPPYKKEEMEILAVSADGKLLFGRRNRGGGLVISAAQIDDQGKLKGQSALIGFVIQDDFPDDVKKQMKFIIENPNTFSLIRK